MKMTGFNFKNKGKAFIFWAVVISLSSLFIFRCGQAPQDETQSSLLDKQSSIITADHNRRIFFNSSHDQIKFGYAVQSCFVKLGGNFLVDGYNSFCGEYNQNQNISTGSVAYVNEIKINGRNVRITGQVVQVQSCDIDVSQIIDKARQNNNNSVIPSQFIRDGKLKLENNDSLTLPSGVYYFKEIKVSGRAVLEFLGPATVVVEGDVSVDGQGQIKTNPVFLRIISTGEFKVEGQGVIYGGIVGNKVEIKGRGQIFGGVISRDFKGEGQGAVHFDKGLGLDRIEVFPSEVTIKVVETVQLTAVAKDIFGNEISCVAFEWLSENSQVAQVGQTGLVRGVGVGTTYVIAKILWFEGKSLIRVLESEIISHLWARTYGTPANDWSIALEKYNIPVLQTSDGGFIVATTNESDDILVLKLDPDGNIQWQKKYGGSFREIVNDMIQTSDGGYILTGIIGYNYFTGTGYDALIIKLDSQGNIQWQKIYDVGYTFEGAGKIIKTSDEGFIISAGGDDSAIIKLDQNGNIQWYRTLGYPGGGDGFNFRQTSDGGYIGISTLPGVILGLDFGVVKLDSEGNIQWSRAYGGNGAWDVPYSIHETSDGGFVVVGVTNSFSSTNINDTNIWVLKLNSQGDIIWQKEYGVPNATDYAFSSIQTPDGGYIIVGFTTASGMGDLLLMKIDSEGNIVWQKVYGGTYPDSGISIQMTSDGNLIISGATYSFGAGNIDIWVLKTDIDGNIPECPHIGTANLSAYITSAIVIAHPIQQMDITISSVNYSALPFQNLDAVSLLQCLYP
jgi:hypothetical protein